jgi:hypothetical protein
MSFICWYICVYIYIYIYTYVYIYRYIYIFVMWFCLISYNVIWVHMILYDFIWFELYCFVPGAPPPQTPPISQPPTSPDRRWVGGTVSLLVSRPVGQAVGRTVGCSDNQTDGQTDAWSVRRMVDGRSVGRTGCRSYIHSCAYRECSLDNATWVNGYKLQLWGCTLVQTWCTYIHTLLYVYVYIWNLRVDPKQCFLQALRWIRNTGWGT